MLQQRRIDRVNILHQRFDEFPAIREVRAAIKFKAAVAGCFGDHERLAFLLEEKRIRKMIRAFQNDLVGKERPSRSSVRQAMRPRPVA